MAVMSWSDSNEDIGRAITPVDEFLPSGRCTFMVQDWTGYVMLGEKVEVRCKCAVKIDDNLSYWNNIVNMDEAVALVKDSRILVSADGRKFDPTLFTWDFSVDLGESITVSFTAWVSFGDNDND